MATTELSLTSNGLTAGDREHSKRSRKDPFMRRLWSPSLTLIFVAAPNIERVVAQTKLPEVTVTVPWDRLPGGSLELGRESPTGSRLGLTLLEIPAAVEVIPGEVIRERGDLTAQEAVTRATGITAAGTPGDGSSALVSRGFAGHSSVMQLYDGTRLYVGAGTMTFPTDTWLFDRIEVLRGPASVLYGEGAIGGAINYIPRQPLRTGRVTDVLLSGGSDDTYRVGLNTTGPLAGYYITKENLLSREPGNPTVTQQIGEQFAYGVEATLGLRLTSYLTVDANIALLDAQFDDFTEVSGGVPVSRDGNRPPNVPELAANLWAVFSPTPAWRLGGGMRYVGERYADNANTVRVPDYTLFDAFVAYTPARWVNLALRGRNLTDATYAIAPYGPTQFILGEPRVIELVANLRF
jgi:outer membrane receptor protein involved in Fe transport